MPGQIDVTINPATGSTLKDPGTTKLGTIIFPTAHWVKADARIGGFRIEAKDSTAYYPFTTPPPTDFRNDVELTVDTRRTGVFYKGEWEYKIIWKNSFGAPGTTLDPKIAVNPIIGFSLVETILIVVAAMSGMIFLVRRFTKRKAKIGR